MILANSLISYQHLSRLREVAEEINSTNKALLALRQGLSLIKDVETGGRGYVLTGDREYLQPYLAAGGRVDHELARVEQGLEVNSQYAAELRGIRKLVAETTAFINQAVQMRDAEGPEAATTLISRTAGKLQMDRIRQLAGRVEDGLEARLAQLTEHSQQSFETALGTFVVATTCAVTLMAVVFILIRRKMIASQKHAEELQRYALASQNDVERLTAIESELRRTNNAKDALLAMLGHELRNPLAAIVSAAELLRLQPPGDPLYEQAQDILDRHLQHLSRLVDEMLDFSRIGSGNFRLDLQTLDLAEIVHNAVQTVRWQIDSRQHRLNVHLPERKAYVYGDAARLEQVFVNLLANAAKYTDPQGQIDVTLESGENHCAVRVRDNGIGISPEHLPLAFQMFAQLNPSIDRAEGGLGIGLTVVKTLVELHHGTVEAHSKGLGHGTEFIVSLPCAPAPDVAIDPSSNGRPTPRPVQPARVMVVEDNPDIARVMAALVKRCGHEPCIAHDGPTALKLAHQFHPQVALLDIGLPGMSGHDLARRMREDQELRFTRLVALTGYGQEEDRRRSREAGFDEHLTKPVSLARLQAILSAQASSRAERSAGSRTEA
jgi:signal transduction histidine kinase/ActR/RegA family two-component response regulator